MEKITKNVLKDIVKECLIEILAEGVFPDGQSKTSSKARNLKESIRNSMPATPRQKASLERESPKRKRASDRLLKTARNLTNDPVLNEVLADTAQTTLQNQLSADSKGSSVLSSISGMPGADKAAVVVENNDPSDLFGEETAGKWAQLAFSG